MKTRSNFRAIHPRLHYIEWGVAQLVAEARHLLNNQLTSALAEIQLLLLDVTDDEARESYVVIHNQLRSMRDVIAGMIRTRGSSRWA